MFLTLLALIFGIKCFDTIDCRCFIGNVGNPEEKRRNYSQISPTFKLLNASNVKGENERCSFAKSKDIARSCDRLTIRYRLKGDRSLDPTVISSLSPPVKSVLHKKVCCLRHNQVCKKNGAPKNQPRAQQSFNAAHLTVTLVI